ncbi:MAG: hypothetical protein K2I64_00845 [Muribaculaceae bacterium]|nr:hypothetical protein [Muribaculaceae bacterium]
MKKLYTLALAALCALGASAAAPTLHSLNISKKHKITETTNATAAKQTFVKKMTKVTPKADNTVVSIEGTYSMEIGDFYLTQTPSIQNIDVEVAYVDKTKGVISFTDVNKEYFVTSIGAIYDESEGTITFMQVDLGEINTTSGKTMYFQFSPYIYVYGETEEEGDVKLVDTFDATFDNTTGTIEFLSDEGYFGFSWPAYADNTYGEIAGWFGLFDVYTAIQSEPGAQLIDLGEAEIVENITYGGFTGQLNSTAYTTTIMKDAEKEIYYVKDPLHATYEAIGAEKYTSPELIFDATDPDNVLINLTSTDIDGGDTAGIYKYACTEVMKDMVTGTLPVTKITLTHEGKNYTLTCPDKSMMMLASTSKQLYWCSGETTIKFVMASDGSGVDNVAVDNENAPVEYYNLLGNRVINPAKGQIIIKKQGTTVTKLIVK